MNDIIAIELRRGHKLTEIMNNYRVAVLSEAMAVSGHKPGKAAALLGIHRNTLNYWIKQLRREVGIRRVK